MTTKTAELTIGTQDHDFRSTLVFESSPEKVFEAVTSTEAVSSWWSKTTGSAEDGGEITVWFGDRQMRGRVATDRPRLAQWDVTFCDAMEDWIGTTVRFEIAPLGEGAVLSFTHLGLTPQLKCFSQCFSGWTFFLGSLLDYVDNGGGTPNGSESDLERRRSRPDGG